MRQMVLDRLAEAAQSQGRRMACLLLLERIDRACFLQAAATHFADGIHASDDTVGHQAAFMNFLLTLHERDTELIVDVVEHTKSVDAAAGQRLCGAILAAIDDPRCRDELGFLAASALADRLECA
jgi:hypothetical protein